MTEDIAYGEFMLEFLDYQSPEPTSTFSQPWIKQDQIQNLPPHKFWDLIDRQNQLERKRLPPFARLLSSRVVSQSPCERNLKEGKRMARKDRSPLQKSDTAINNLSQSGQTMATRKAMLSLWMSGTFELLI